jgi:AcrR family transcriptional regulator
MPVLVDREKTRLQIAELAIGLIAADGMQGLSTRRVAEAAGTSRGLVSTYFRDMRELTLASFDLVFLRWNAIFEVVEAEDLGSQGLVEAILPFDAQRQEYWRVVVAFFGMTISDPEFITIQKEINGKAAERFERLLAKEAGTAKITPAIRVEARRLLTSAIGIGVHHTVTGAPTPGPSRRREMVEMVLARPIASS